MILISRSQRDRLDRFGLLVYSGQNKSNSNKEVNVFVANRHHRGRNKKYYVAEEQDIMLFLEMYDNLNLQRIRPGQLNKLINAGLVTEDNIQRPNEYKPDATVFVANDGQIRCKKITAYMVEAGIWNNKLNKKQEKQN